MAIDHTKILYYIIGIVPDELNVIQIENAVTVVILLYDAEELHLLSVTRCEGYPLILEWQAPGAVNTDIHKNVARTLMDESGRERKIGNDFALKVDGPLIEELVLGTRGYLSGPGWIAFRPEIIIGCKVLQ